MKKLTAIILCITLCIVMMGCNGRKAIENYPGMAPETGDAEEETGNDAGSVEEVKYSDGKAFYTVKGGHGENAYRVEAEIVGDEKDTFPVYDIKFWDMRTQDLYNLSAYLVGARDANYLLPLDIADEEYLANRLVILEKRRDKLLEKGKEVNHAITSEMEAIKKEMSRDDFSSRFTVPSPTVPELIDLHDYYESEYGVETDLQFSFSENVDPDGNVLRLDVIKYRGATSMKLYYVDYNYDDSNNYYLGSSEQVLPASFDKIDKGSCEELAMNFISTLDIGEMELTRTFPACDYGAFKDGSEDHAYEKAAYCCFCYPNIKGKQRPCNSATDFFSNNTNATRPLITAHNITTILAEGEEQYTSYEGDSGSVNDTGLYDSFCVCVGEGGKPIEVLATNLIYGYEIKTEKAKQLPFSDIDLCAQKYLAYSAVHDTEGNEKTIDRIELGMCRTIGENGSMFMVPAWYYLLKSTEVNPLQEPVMAVNAIDGSIIDVKAGGTTVTF